MQIATRLIAVHCVLLLDRKNHRAGQTFRREVEFHLAAKFIGTGLLDQACSEAGFGGGSFNLRPVSLLPLQAYPLRLVDRLDPPRNPQTALLAGEGAIFRRVGAELMQDQAQTQALLGVDVDGAPLDLDDLRVIDAVGRDRRLRQHLEAGISPVGFQQQIVCRAIACRRPMNAAL